MSSEGTTGGVSPAIAMRALTALLILVACQCLHGHQYPRTSRHYIKYTLNELLEKQSKPLRSIVNCTSTLGVSKCISALAVWRAECAVGALLKDSAASFNLTKDLEKFPWKRYGNNTDEQLQTQLLDSTQKLLQYRPLKFDMIPGYTAKLTSKNNGSVSFDIAQVDEVESRSSMKKLKKEFFNIAPILLAPGLFISAFVPFLLPSLKMMVLMVGFVNQIALVGAIFTILRNNAFNDQPDHKVVYVNEGYENEKQKFAPSNIEEHFHTNHLGILYDDTKTRGPNKPVIDPPFDDNFDTIEEISPLSVSPQWIKEYTDNKMLAHLKDHPNNNYFYNGGLPLRRSKTEAVKAST